MPDKDVILVVDDNERLLTAVRRILEGEGHSVVTAEDGLAALEMLETIHPSLIIADITMPQMNGYQLHERVRQNPEWLLTPFIFLTGRAMDSDIRYGREIGVDDYLIKPIAPEDLVVAVRGKLKRARQWAQRQRTPDTFRDADQNAFDAGALHIVPKLRRVEINGNPLELSAKEFALLAYLARRPGEIVSAQTLVGVTHALDAEREEAGSLVRPLIRSLRRKLGYPVGDLGCIETVRGVGYRLLPPDG